MSIEKCTQIVYNNINKINQTEVIKAKMKQLEEIINDLYQNNGRKIHQMCNKRLHKFGGLAQKDYDDFYSAANEACTLAMGTYEENKGSFEGYLYRTIQFAIIDEIQKRNRYKRRAERLCISIDMPVGEDESCTLGGLLTDSFDMEKAVFGEEIEENPKIERYLNRLSKCQRKIVELLAASYGAAEIQEVLHITQREYADAMTTIRSYENIKILF